MLELLQSVPVFVWVFSGVFAWFSAAVAVATVACHISTEEDECEPMPVCVFLWPLVFVHLLTSFVLIHFETKYTTCAKCGLQCREKRDG